jgi:hypothetical protein
VGDEAIICGLRKNYINMLITNSHYFDKCKIITVYLTETQEPYRLEILITQGVHVID